MTVPLLHGLSRPKSIDRTGDDTPASSLLTYVWRMTGRTQITACALAIVTTLLSLAPIELQRRLFDDALADRDADLLFVLGGVYLATVLALQVAKFALGVLAGWMSESAVAYTRSHLWGLEGRAEMRDKSSVLLTEANALGAFAGGAPSKLVANLSLLVGALGYMFWVDPVVALAGLALIAPQAAIAPLMQRRLNHYITIRLKLMRRYSAAIDRENAPEGDEMAARLRSLHRARMAFLWWKFLLKAALNALNAAAPLGVILVGGWLVMQGQSTVGVIVAFVGGFSRLGDPIRELIGFYREAQEASVRHDLIADWMRRLG